MTARIACAPPEILIGETLRTTNATECFNKIAWYLGELNAKARPEDRNAQIKSATDYMARLGEGSGHMDKLLDTFKYVSLQNIQSTIAALKDVGRMAMEAESEQTAQITEHDSEGLVTAQSTSPELPSPSPPVVLM
jgi:hypothetical protein